MTISMIWRGQPTPSFLELPSLQGPQFAHKKMYPGDFFENTSICKKL
jgi:hypothetical protein